MKTAIEPAVLPTKACHDYVGGRPTWDELFDRYGKGKKPLLTPFRRTPQGNTYYLRSVVDDVLLRAQMEGALINQPGE